MQAIYSKRNTRFAFPDAAATTFSAVTPRPLIAAIFAAAKTKPAGCDHSLALQFCFFEFFPTRRPTNCFGIFPGASLPRSILSIGVSNTTAKSPTFFECVTAPDTETKTSVGKTGLGVVPGKWWLSRKW